jgi:hypothetical protein
MRTLVVTLLVTLFAVPAAFAADRRSRDLDECSRRTAQCERLCDGRQGADRLSCKTNCRLAESQCRNAARR